MLAIGKVVKPQGLKGEMKILPFGDACLFDVKTFYIDGKEYSVEQVSARPNGVFVKLVGFDTIESIQGFRNKEIEISVETAREKIGNDKFLWQDIFDSKIILSGENGDEEYGVVDDIDNFGATDVVFARAGDKNFSFPIVKGLIKEILEGQLVLDKKRFLEVVCYED